MLIYPNSTIAQKITASWVNMALVITLALPFLYIDIERWKFMTVACFALYTALFTYHRDPGMRFAGTYNCANSYHVLTYIVCYTFGFSTLFYWVIFPADLFLLNGLLQAICLYNTGNTLHGWIADYNTVNEAGYLHNMDKKERHP